MARDVETEHELVRFKMEREAAAKAVEEADKKNRESEKQAFKDIGNFVIDTLTPVGDIRAVYDWLQGDKNARSTLAAVLGVVGIKGATSKADELADLIESQARDAKLWAKQGGAPPPKEAIDEYAKQGVLPISKETGEPSWDKLRPAAAGERNQSAFPVKKDELIVDQDGMAIVNGEQVPVATVTGNKAEQQMVEYTQAQGNPGATSGMKPQAPAPAGSTLKEVENLAIAREKQWKKGWDAEAFKSHVESAMKTRVRDAAKGKEGGVPEFWIYDEAKKGLIVVKRDKNGNLYVGSPKGRPPDLFKRYKEGEKKGKVVRDPNGNPVLSDKIDMVVPSDAEGEVTRMMYELLLDKLDTY